MNDPNSFGSAARKLLASDPDVIARPFEVNEEGVFWRKQDSGATEAVKLASRVDVMAKTRDASGCNWGRLLKWKDCENREHQWAMPMEALASDAGAIRARLLSEGLAFLTTNIRLRERFAEYLQTAPATTMVRCVTRVGWHGGTYVMPDQPIGPDGAEDVLYQNPNEAVHYWRCQGTSDEWREHVGRKCSGNSRLLIAVAAAFAGPILSLVGTESGGIHFHGGTSTGKSTALTIGGSVCGGGGQGGFVQSWRTTINGLEAIAESHHDGTLFLDELAQADPREAAETAYLLGNGQGKARMTRSIGVRRKPTWTLLFVSAGELTLSEHAASAGKKTRGGADVRLLNIDADAGRSMGIFEDLHGCTSPDLFSRYLKDSARRYYGSPFPIYIRKLVESRSDVEREVRAAREEFIQRFVPTGSPGEIKRAADRFSLIAAAGELATEWGLTGWKEGESIGAAERCFREWMDQRGTVGASDIDAAIRQVRAFIEANGASRFQPIRSSALGGVGEHPDDAKIVRDRAGFRRQHPETGETEYLILPEAFRKEVCNGFSYRAVVKELDQRELLVRTPPDMTIKPRLPELGIVRVYCIRAAILGDEEC